MTYTRLPYAMAVFALTLVWAIAISTQARQQKGPCIGSYPCPTPAPTVSPARKPTQSPKPTPYLFPVSQTAEGYTVNLGKGGRRLELVRLTGDTFTMGSDRVKENVEEQPPHLVHVSAFAIGKYEITQSQWLAVMGGENPSGFGKDLSVLDRGDLPVEKVSWYDAREFCARLSKATGQTFRLPTEAEWEYAARASNQSEYSFGDDNGKLGQFAWYGEKNGMTHPVGTKTANGFNLFDMEGNVREWCSDWYDGANYYAELKRQGVAVDPQGPGTTRSSRVARGCSWKSDGNNCRSASRGGRLPSLHDPDIGFRIVKSVRQR